MTSIPLLIDALSSRGIYLAETNGGITYRAPAGALTAEDKAIIRERKSEFLTFLRARAAAEAGLASPGAHGASRPSFYQEVWWHWFKDVPVCLPYEQIHLVRRFANVEAARITAALATIVGRHDALRMHFYEGPEGLMAGLQDSGSFRAEMHRLDDESRLAGLLQQFFAQSPRVRDAWLIRSCVVSLPGGDAVVAVAMHHTVCDGASYLTVIAELDAETGQPGSLPPTQGLSYRDFVQAERNWFSGERSAALTVYWSGWIARIPVLVGPEQKRPLLWSHGARTVAQTFLSQDKMKRLVRASGAFRTSPFIMVLTAFVLALKNWSGQSHFAVRSVADGRTHESIAATVGLILRHYLVEADIAADVELAALVKALAVEHECGAELRFPTHWESSGADFRSLHQRIGPTFNYLSVPSTAGERAPDLASNGSAATSWKPAEPWPAWLPPIQLRVLHFIDGIGLVFEFNDAVLDRREQEGLIQSCFRALDVVSAASSPT